MATFTSKDIQLLFIGQAATATTGGISAMNDGEIGIFTPSGVRLTEATAATAEKFIIVKKTPNGGVPLVSPVINKRDITKTHLKVYSPLVNQLVTVGYNGTSGSIDVINDNDYHVRISLRAEYVDNHGGLYIKHGWYRSDVNATQYEIATALVKNIVANFSKEPEQVVKVTMLCNDAGVATTGNINVVHGSRAIFAVTPADFQVGGLVRLGTATTTSTYKVVSIIGNAVTVDSPINETTQTYVAGSAESISLANATAASFGFIVEGVTLGHVTGKIHNDLMPVSFDLTLEGFGATSNVLVNGAYPGSGTQKQVRELEWFCQGNEGDFYRMGEPNIITPRAEATGNYDLIDIQTLENYTGSIVSGPIHKAFTLAIPQTAPNYAVTGTANDITDVLEVLTFGAVNGSLTVS